MLNVDKTGLFFMMFYLKLCFKNYSYKDGKLLKERLTVLLYYGRKVVLGKSSSRCSLKNLDIRSHLSVSWKKVNLGEPKKICSDDSQFSNEKIKRQKRKLCFVWKRCLSSKRQQVSQYNIAFFQSKTTSIYHPLVLGIIQAFKIRYSKMLMGKLISELTEVPLLIALS